MLGFTTPAARSALRRPAAACGLAAASMEMSPLSQKVLLCCGLAGIVFSPLFFATVMVISIMVAGCLPTGMQETMKDSLVMVASHSCGTDSSHGPCLPCLLLQAAKCEDHVTLVGRGAAEGQSQGGGGDEHVVGIEGHAGVEALCAGNVKGLPQWESVSTLDVRMHIQVVHLEKQLF